MDGKRKASDQEADLGLTAEVASAAAAPPAPSAADGPAPMDTTPAAEALTAAAAAAAGPAPDAAAAGAASAAGVAAPVAALPDPPFVLGVPHRGVTPRRVEALSHGVLVLSQGSVAQFEGDAARCPPPPPRSATPTALTRAAQLVNAANKGCLGGGGVDGAINDAGGWRLEEARHALPLLRPYVRCETGDAKVTVGGALRVKHVIHAVGPDYRVCVDDAQGDALLRSAYTASMRAARGLGARTVAFALISAAIFRGDRPLRAVLALAVKAVKAEAYPGLQEVHLVAFTTVEIRALLAAAAATAEAALYAPAQVTTTDKQGDGAAAAHPGEAAHPPAATAPAAEPGTAAAEPEAAAAAGAEPATTVAEPGGAAPAAETATKPAVTVVEPAVESSAEPKAAAERV